ncbi:hypothetical protein [Allopontixanthobacter sp.]|uniref:hypothetical protein n=1 Tax=Allopontixanthobacter sp. TaxID=2906452 RepID=UPI002ABBD31E|nr:hypothetical protein [Allopontixanthobacter sp.]MDZ4307185.1 hypothetical protein [Allopontixanthobacter sp.]
MTGFLIVAFFAAVAVLSVAVLTDSGLRGLAAYRALSAHVRCNEQYVSIMYKVVQSERCQPEPTFRMRGTVRGAAPRVIGRRREPKLRAAA